MGTSRRFIRIPLVVAAALVIVLTGAHAARAGQGTGLPAPPAPAASPPAPVPFPNRLNHVLPTWLRVRAEFRERMESIDNAAFVGGRDDTYFLSRLRVTATVAPSKSASFQLQLQDARVAGKEAGFSGVPFTGPIDVRMAFADLGASSGPLTARVGRQELFFGEQRLVGHGNWVNAARSFDAGRLTIRRTGLQVDLFAASLVRILPDEWDKSGNGSRFYGTYAATTVLVPKSTVEPYVFWREDRGLRVDSGGTGNLHQGTTGVRWNGSWPTRFEYDVETAVQRGSVGSDTVRAWAGHVRITSASFGPALRVTSEYNYASGDADPTDGIRGTFDQLYPTPHDKYGLADQVGWRNIHHVRAGFDLARIKTLPVTVNYHTWWLAEAADALYSASGALLARVPGGADSRHVGQEVDVQVSRALTPYLQLAAGYAYLSPGGFLEQATPGASYSTPFVMLTYVFLAEK